MGDLEIAAKEDKLKTRDEVKIVSGKACFCKEVTSKHELARKDFMEASL